MAKVVPMSEEEKRIERISEQAEIDAIREYNQKITQREEKIGNFIYGIRPWAYLSFPLLATVGIFGIIGYSSCGEVRKYNSAIEHLQAGNYNLAKNELETFPGSDLEYIVTAMNRGHFLSSEDAQMYGTFHNPQQDMTVRKFLLKGEAVTSLESLKASDGTDFLAVGTEQGEVYFFNEHGSLRIGVEGVHGNIYATRNKDYIVVGSQNGKIYKLGVEAVNEKDQKKYKVLFNTIFESRSQIGEIRPYDITGDGVPEYFFTASNGEAYGVTLDGETVFHSEAKAKEEIDGRISPKVVSFCGNADRYVVTPLDDTLIIYRSSGKIETFFLLEQKLDKEILVGDFDGSGCSEILAASKNYANRFGLQCNFNLHPNSITGLKECYWTSHQMSIGDISIASWKVQDVNFDGLDDVVYGEEEKLGILFGDEVVPLATKWETEKWNPLKDYWSDITSLTVDPESIPNKPLVAVHPRHIQLYTNGLAPLVDEFEYADSEINGKRIFKGEFNGKKRIGFVMGGSVMGDSAYLFGNHWSQMDKPEQ